MSRHLRSPYGAAIAGSAVLALALTACGSEDLGTGDKSTGPAGPTTSVKAEQTLADKVPAALKAKGTLNIGTDASYPPNEYMGSDGKTPEGMDIDLFKAVLAKLSLKGNFQNGGFDSLILGVGSGKYDASISSFTINPERKQQVTMVSYFKAGSQWVVPKGNPKKVNIDTACGLSIGVQKGTVQVDDINKRSAACKTAGKAEIKPVIEDQQSKVTLDLSAGKVDAMVADLPVSIDAVDKGKGKLELLASNYDTAPYGIVVKKDQTEFANVLVEALKAIKADGTYDTILKKWKTEGGAINDFAVNP